MSLFGQQYKYTDWEERESEVISQLQEDDPRLTNLHLSVRPNQHNSSIGNSKPIADIGAAKLAKTLESNTQLHELSLCSNQITDCGATLLARALELNHGLKSLSLFGNQITDVGANALGEMLKVNRCLETLNLNNNEFTHTGTRALITGLMMNTTLWDLGVCGRQSDSINITKTIQKLTSAKGVEQRRREVARATEIDAMKKQIEGLREAHERKVDQIEKQSIEIDALRTQLSELKMTRTEEYV